MNKKGNNVDNNDELKQLMDEAKELYTKGKYKESIELYKKAIELDSNNAEAYNNMGAVYCKLKEYDKAIEKYEKAIKTDPNYTKAYYNIGNTYGLLKEYNKAIEKYEEAIKLNPYYSDAYHNMGNAYYRLKEYNKAIEKYEEAIKIDPKQIYKENLSYTKNQIAIEENRKKIEEELRAEYGSFYGELISKRIKEEKIELNETKDKIKWGSYLLIVIFIGVLGFFIFLYICYLKDDIENLHFFILQSNFTALFISYPIIWVFNTLSRRKKVLELSIHDLQDKHYLISLFQSQSEENREKYTDKMFGIMSEDSTAKLLKSMYKKENNKSKIVDKISIDELTKLIEQYKK
ncbi:MAG: Unknown protein [uncultured Campylobacterales bacterium]|uniref:Uncharacterized protein n=1 Tax=uncultured Campylobacterales bacterium TaxID=352960 RepID=A0A6S6SN67_9BACT|nr:MAG: Unknown protein [uncultured Campylobacterales bacterium]